VLLPLDENNPIHLIPTSNEWTMLLPCCGEASQYCAKWIWTLFSKLIQILNHMSCPLWLISQYAHPDLMAVLTYTMDVSAFTPFLWGFKYCIGHMMWLRQYNTPQPLPQLLLKHMHPWMDIQMENHKITRWQADRSKYVHLAGLITEEIQQEQPW
jgi:hypothetical protein